MWLPFYRGKSDDTLSVPNVERAVKYQRMCWLFKSPRTEELALDNAL